MASPNILTTDTDNIAGMHERIVLATDDYAWLKSTHHVYADGGVLAPSVDCSDCGAVVSFAAAFRIMNGQTTKRDTCCIDTAAIWIADVEQRYRQPAADILKASASREAGSFAWVATDESDVMLAYGFGILEAAPYGVVTNNMTEFLALLQIIRRLPRGWSGVASTDSGVTHGRFSKGWKLTGIPTDWFPAFGAALANVDVNATTWRLLQGHPLKSEIERMKNGEQVVGSKRGLPVSLHQDFCDTLCTSTIVQYKAGHFGSPFELLASV